MVKRTRILPKKSNLYALDECGEPKKICPEIIVIHWIGPYPGQFPDDVWRWWATDSGFHSAHFVVKNDSALQCAELCDFLWHSGDERNSEAIGIEAIPMNEAGEFSPSTIETLAQLCWLINQRFSIKSIQRHFDGAQRKDCPRFYTPMGGTNGEAEWIKLKGILETRMRMRTMEGSGDGQ